MIGAGVFRGAATTKGAADSPAGACAESERRVRRWEGLLPTLSLLAVAAALALGAGGCDDPGVPPCELGLLPDGGWVPPASATATPLEVAEVRRVICLHGGVPCAPSVSAPVPDDPGVAAVYVDGYLDWVHYLIGVVPGRTDLRMNCPIHGERAFRIVVP